MEDTYSTLYFDNFFTSPMLVTKLLEKRIYGIGIVRKYRKKTLPQWKQVSFSSETAWNGSIIVVGKKKKR